MHVYANASALTSEQKIPLYTQTRTCLHDQDQALRIAYTKCNWSEESVMMLLRFEKSGAAAVHASLLEVRVDSFLFALTLWLSMEVGVHSRDKYSDITMTHDP